MIHSALIKTYYKRLVILQFALSFIHPLMQMDYILEKYLNISASLSLSLPCAHSYVHTHTHTHTSLCRQALMLGIMNYGEGACDAGFSSINKTSAWPSLWDRVLGIGRMGLIVTLTVLSLPSLLVLYFQSVSVAPITRFCPV